MRNKNSTTLARFVPLALCIAAGFFFAEIGTANAEEPCLRTATGECVEIASFAPTSSAQAEHRFIFGENGANNFFPLEDGTHLLVVAEPPTSMLPSQWYVRYELQLYISEDNGLSWKKASVANKGSWYVDQIISGSNGEVWPSGSAKYIGAHDGTGFLGFSLDTYKVTNQAIQTIFLTHTATCASGGIVFNDDHAATCGSGGRQDGTVFLDIIEYDTTNKTFTQKGVTRAITRSVSARNGDTYPNTVNTAYLSMTGATHPSIAVSGYDPGTGQYEIWVSYHAYIGDLCAISSQSESTRCVRQNGGTSFNGRSYSEIWARRIKVRASDGQLTSDTTVSDGSNADNFLIESFQTAQSSPFPPGTPPNGYATVCVGNVAPTSICHDERHAFYSSLSLSRNWTNGVPGKPILFYGYSKPGTAYTDLRWSSWDVETSAWVNQGSLNDYLISGSGWINNQEPSELVAAVDMSGGAAVGTPINVVRSLQAFGSPYLAFYSLYPYISRFNLVNLVTYADVADEGGSKTAVPVYIRLFNEHAGDLWNPIEGLYLGDKSNGTIAKTSQEYQDRFGLPQADVKVNVAEGGPTFAWAVNRGYVAVPGAPVTNFNAKATDVFITKLNPPDGYSPDSSAWNLPVTNSWMDITSPTSDIPIWGQITQNNPGSNAGVSAPLLARFINAHNSVDQDTILTNTFFPPAVFMRAKGDITGYCQSGKTCDIAYTGERYTYGIRGWAWADSVGWISLSCDNLRSCFSKSYDSLGNAWSSTEGGLYYSVRAIADDTFDKPTLLGKMWSERVGYLSFDRADSVSVTNVCGNPPEGFQLSHNNCVVLNGNIMDAEAAPIVVRYLDGTAIGNFPDPASIGSLLIDNEIIQYTGYTTNADNTATLLGVKRGSSLANNWFRSIARSHTAGTPLFYITNGDVTHQAYEGWDIYQGINTYDKTTFLTIGWARSIGWKEYQDTYCGANVGLGFAPPCDKEWGWISLQGEWNTMNPGHLRAPANASCNTTNLYLDSVDGYPDPEGGVNEKVYVDFQCEDFAPCASVWEYSSIDKVNRKFDLTSALPPYNFFRCHDNDVGIEALWATNISGGGITNTATTIPLFSISGLNREGKIEIVEGANREVVYYSQINTTTNPPRVEFVTRAQDGTVAQAFTEAARVTQVNQTGTYDVVTLPLSEFAPEYTIAGYAWSAPNTDNPTADPFASRYRNNISGFGWLSFQPNRLEQILPYLRTLFNDVYVGGQLEFIGPSSSIANPRQFTSTYLLQSDGAITPFDPSSPASSGQYQQCFDNCSGNLTCESQCRTLFFPSDAPDISLEPGSSSVLGRLPDQDAISTWVSGCRNYLGDLVDSDNNGVPDGGCPAHDDQARFINIDDAALLPTPPDPALAVSGINKFGHHVVLCRPNPLAPFIYDPEGVYHASSIFGAGSGYVGNPDECRWQSSLGRWSGTLAEDYTQGETFVCVTPDRGVLTAGLTGTTSFGDNESQYVIPPANTNCTSGTEITLTSDASAFLDTVAGEAIQDADPMRFYKVNRSHLGLPTVYMIPEQYHGLALLNFHGQPMQFTAAPEGESGAITLSFPTSIFFLDSAMRYCPGSSYFPCSAPEDTTDISITNISQLPSVGWLVRGSVGNLDGFILDHSFFTEPKMYRVGAFVLYDDPNETWQILGKNGVFMSHYMLATGLQFNLYGMVIAPNYVLLGTYLAQDADGLVIEPSENFVYDGRVVLNPPPGFEDLSTGLPSVRRVTP